MKPNLASKWVVRFNPKTQPHCRLFCLPHAGGGASNYRTWSQNLPDHIEVCAIRLPGRESRLAETPFTEAKAVAQILQEVLEPFLDIPVALFGHSMGTIISLELARMWEQQTGVNLIHLFVSGRRAPHLPSRRSPIYHLSEAEFIEGLRSYKGTPEIIFQNQEFMALLLPVLRADFTLSQTYKGSVSPLLRCPISAFGGKSDDTVYEDDMAAWQEYTQQHFKLQMYKGGHFFLQKVQPQLLQAITQDLILGLNRPMF